MFEVSETKEYYLLLRQRALALLRWVETGGGEDEVERLTDAVLCYSKPKRFTGSGSEEIVFDRNFETICLSLSEQLHIRPKECTVFEFYNAFSFLQERARKAGNGRKRP